jgi:hypothetical protein
MGKIHRDVKGGNILLTDEGHVKLGLHSSLYLFQKYEIVLFTSNLVSLMECSGFWCFGNININIFKKKYICGNTLLDGIVLIHFHSFSFQSHSFPFILIHSHLFSFHSHSFPFILIHSHLFTLIHFHSFSFVLIYSLSFISIHSHSFSFHSHSFPFILTQFHSFSFLSFDLISHIRSHFSFYSSLFCV